MNHDLSKRTFLKTAATLAASTVVAACSQKNSTTTPASSPAVETANQANPSIRVHSNQSFPCYGAH